MEEQKYTETHRQGNITYFEMGDLYKGRLFEYRKNKCDAFITEKNGEKCDFVVCFGKTRKEAIFLIQTFGFEPSTRYLLKIKERGKPIFFATKEGLVDYCKSNSIVPCIVTMQVLKNTWIVTESLVFSKKWEIGYDFFEKT